MKKKIDHGIYGITEAEEFIDRMVYDHYYNAVQTDDGCLGIGNWSLYPPTEEESEFEIIEECLNEWSSGQRILEYR